MTCPTVRSHVCVSCFADPVLRELVAAEGMTIPECPCCGAKEVAAVPLEFLGEAFRGLLNMYAPSDGPLRGDPIEYLIQEEWEPFSDTIAEDPDKLRFLTVAILEAGLTGKDLCDYPDFEGGFERRGDSLADGWAESIDAILAKTSSSTQQPGAAAGQSDSPSLLAVALEDIVQEYPAGATLFRARIHKDRTRIEPFEPGDLGAPSPEKSPAGRGNAAGQPVLYLASDVTTAVAEVRGWVGMAIAVAEVTLLKNLSIIDLRHRAVPRSPFFDDLINWRSELAGLLEAWAEDLARPVLPHEEPVLYLPSQHLCMLVRNEGYDGLAYPSGLGPGYNVILFDASSGLVQNVQYIRITGLTHTFEEVPEGWPLYQESPYDAHLPPPP